MADSLIKGDDDKVATIELWQEIRHEIFDNEYPEAVLVSEWSDHEKSLRAGFHGDFYLDHYGNGYNRLFRYIKNDVNYSFFNGTGDIASFLSDYMPRFHIANHHGGHVCFISGNHDSFRIGSNGYTERMLRLMHSFLLTMPGVPFVYNGDEIGMDYMHGLPSKEGGFQRTGSRTPMQWDSSVNMGFSTASKENLYLPLNYDKPVNVEEQLTRSDSLLRTIKDIIALRKEYKGLRSRCFEVIYAEPHAYPFVYGREDIIVMVNPSDHSRRISGDYYNLKSLYNIGEVNLNGSYLEMSPWSFAIYKKEV